MESITTTTKDSSTSMHTVCEEKSECEKRPATSAKDTMLPLEDLFTIEKAYLAETIYGKIMKARCKATGELVAVKVYDHARSTRHLTRSGHTVLEDVPTELGLLKQLCEEKHAHLLGMHSTAETLAAGNGVDYGVMPFAAGGDLLSYLKDNEVSTQVARRHFVRIVQAVAHLHSLGWAHRDLSLENVLLLVTPERASARCDSHRQPVLSDYGLAVRLGPCAAPTLCRPGKPGYMAPEIYAFKPYDAASVDMYALGVILFGLLARSLPYNAPAFSDVAFRMIQHGKMRALLSAWHLTDSFDDEAVELITKLLSHDPASRPTMEELLSNEWIREAIDEIAELEAAEEAEKVASMRVAAAPEIGTPVSQGTPHELSKTSSSDLEDSTDSPHAESEFDSASVGDRASVVSHIHTPMKDVTEPLRPAAVKGKTSLTHAFHGLRVSSPIV